MSGSSSLKLMDAVKEYLDNPSRPNARQVDAALAGLPTGVDDAIWFVIGVAQGLKGDLAQETAIREKIESLFRDAVKPTIVNTNVQQHGQQNAAQTGDGSQSLHGSPEGKKQ